MRIRSIIHTKWLSHCWDSGTFLVPGTVHRYLMHTTLCKTKKSDAESAVCVLQIALKQNS